MVWVLAAAVTTGLMIKTLKVNVKVIQSSNCRRVAVQPIFLLSVS